MQTPRLMILVYSSVAVLASVAVVYSQLASPAVVPEHRADHFPAAPIELKPLGHLGNVVKFSRAGDDQEKMVADLLRSHAAPAERAANFALILNSPAYHFQGWHLEILDVTAVDGTMKAKVRAMPLITAGGSTTSGGRSATVVSAFDETYEINGGSMKLLKGEEVGASNCVAVIID